MNVKPPLPPRRGPVMSALASVCLSICWLALPAGSAQADDYARTVALFKHAGQSAAFFKSSYGFAVFPTIGKGAYLIGAAHGDGRVYKQGRYVGNTSMTQVSVGFQLGGQVYSEILFFQTPQALARFESGRFELGAQASAVAITAGASASAGTAGGGAGASGGEKNATTAGHYLDGVAVFTIVKGGFMYEAAVAGQKFSFSAVK